MLASNSKLTPAEKLILKDYREEQANTVVYRNSTTTIVVRFNRLNSQLVRFSTSVQSPDEQKFRNKVGEYHARVRFDNGEVSILTRDDFMNLVDVAGFVEAVIK